MNMFVTISTLNLHTCLVFRIFLYKFSCEHIKEFQRCIIYVFQNGLYKCRENIDKNKNGSTCIA